MSTLQDAIAKAPDVVGKVGIAGIATSEAGKIAGVLENVSEIQVISSCGVIWLMIDRTISSINSAETKKAKRVICSIWAAAWLAAITIMTLVML